jgi:hypothetical protein
MGLRISIYPVTELHALELAAAEQNHNHATIIMSTMMRAPYSYVLSTFAGMLIHS